MKKEYLVPAALVVLVAVFALAAFLYDSQKASQINDLAKQNESYLLRDHSPTSGSADAKVTLVEFFDPACETCRAFHPLVKQIMSENPGRIKHVMRYAPLHQGSEYVVALLEAARLQNKYKETLEAMFETQPMWAAHHNPQPEKLWLLLAGVDLNFVQAEKDMQNPVVLQNVKQDIEDMKQLGVSKTPSFFVNGKPLINFGYEELRQLVKSEVDSNY